MGSKYYEFIQILLVVKTKIERYKFREAVNTVIDLARLGNKYLAEEEPWKLIKTDQKERVKTNY